MRILCLLAVVCSCASAQLSPSATGRAAWLRYERLEKPPALPASVVVLGNSEVLSSAREELIRGVQGMTGKILRVESAAPKEGAIVVGRLDALRAAGIDGGAALVEDGWRIRTGATIVVTGENDRGV